MTRIAYIFMDFDGVTHPWGEVEDFRCLPHIEAVVREFPEARIVIASDWRMLFSLPKLVARFGAARRRSADEAGDAESADATGADSEAPSA